MTAELDPVTVTKLQFAIKVIELLDTFLENFSTNFFLNPQMAALFGQLNELFLIFADLLCIAASASLLSPKVLDFLNNYLTMLQTMLEEPVFATEILKSVEITSRISKLGSRPIEAYKGTTGILVVSNANTAKLV